MQTGEKLGKAGGPRVAALGLLGFLHALRPRQWVKNILVFLPFVFAINVAWFPANPAPVPELWLRVVAVFFSFCALSSGVYLFNDLMDREADRVHPVKRHRPIASGRVSVALAIGGMLALILAGLGRWRCSVRCWA